MVSQVAAVASIPMRKYSNFSSNQPPPSRRTLLEGATFGKRNQLKRE